MDVHFEKSGKITVATLPPVKKLTSMTPLEKIRENVEAVLIKDETKALVIDLTEVKFGGTRLLSILVMMHIKAKRINKRIKFCNASEFVADGLSKTHLDKILDVYETLEDALINFIV